MTNNPPENPTFIPPHGHYQELLSYQKAEVVYDLIRSTSNSRVGSHWPGPFTGLLAAGV